MQTVTADDLVSLALIESNSNLSKLMSADVIFFRAPLGIGVDDAIRGYIEDIADPSQKGRLCVLIETSGGYIEVVERIYAVFRQHYDEVVFVVPSFAYSAGTVLVLSGDEIYMDYYSVLGPIDPQIEGEDGAFVPGIGYLNKFGDLVDEINSDPTGSQTRAQLAYLIKKFDPAKLFFIEQARDYSIRLLKEWLPKHKFKNWSTTETLQKVVTDADKENRASDIATLLGDPRRWHSHGRGIGIKELESDEIKLKIEDFGKNVDLNKAIREYYNLLMDYLGKTGMESAIHGERGLRRVTL